MRRAGVILGTLAALAVAGMVLPRILNPYQFQVLMLCGINVILAVSLNLALQAHETGRDDEARTWLQAAAPGMRQAFGEAAPIIRRLQRLEQAVASAPMGGGTADGERAAADLFF